MEEKMRQQQTIVQAQEAEAKLNASKHGGIGLGGSKHGMNSSKHGGSRHGLGGSKHGRGGGLMSRLGGGLKNQQQQQQVTAAPVPEDKEKLEAPSTPTALAAAPNQNNDDISTLTPASKPSSAFVVSALATTDLHQPCPNDSSQQQQQ